MKDYVYTLSKVKNNPNEDWVYYYLHVEYSNFFGMTKKLCVTSTSDKASIDDIFNEFCNAKTANVLHSPTEIIVCQYRGKKGKFRITKEYYSIAEANYSIWADGLFEWDKRWSMRKSPDSDALMPDYLRQYVEEGVTMFGRTIIKKC